MHLRIESDEPERPPVFRLSWSHPLVSVHGYWHFGAGYDKGLQVDWGKGVCSKATSGAPVGCLYDLGGRNRLTFALSDALNPVTFHAGVHEESGEASCWVRLFDEPHAPLGVYEATLRLDTRYLPYYETLSDVSRWWAGLPGYEPAGVPETARLPMYSTWYSFHQDLEPGRVEEQCRLAKELGCEAGMYRGRRLADHEQRAWLCLHRRLGAGAPRRSLTCASTSTGARPGDEVPALVLRTVRWAPQHGVGAVFWDVTGGDQNTSGLVSSTRASPRCASS